MNIVFLFYPLLCPLQTLLVLLHVYLFQYASQPPFTIANSRYSKKNILEIQWSKERQPSCSHGAYILQGKVDIKYITTYNYDDCYEGKYRVPVKLTTLN